MEEEIAFPRTFTFQNQEFSAPDYYEISNGGFNEVSPNENFSFLKDTVENEMSYEQLEFPFKEFTFLSDSTVEIAFETDPGNPQNVPTSYTSVANLMFLDIGLSEPLVLRKDAGFDEVEACVRGYYYSYFSTFLGTRRISSITIDPCSFESEEELTPILVIISEDNDLQVGDTIALHTAYLHYVAN